MADVVATTIGSAQFDVRANLDRFERDLARAQDLARKFHQDASSGLNKHSQAAADLDKTYSKFNDTLQQLDSSLSKFNKSSDDTQSRLSKITTFLKESTFVGTLATTAWNKLSSVWDAASTKMQEAMELVSNAGKLGVGVDYFQGLSKSAEKLKIDIGDISTAIQNLEKVTTAVLGGASFGKSIGHGIQSGALQGNTALEDYRLAVSTEQKFEAVSKLITEAYQKGQTLTSLDLASKWLPPEIYERFRAFPDLLEQIIKKQKELAPKDSSATFYAASLQNRLTDAEKRMKDTSDYWEKELAKPWLQRPWLVSAYFQELTSKFGELGIIADTSIKKFIFGITGVRPEVARVRYEFEKLGKVVEQIDNSLVEGAEQLPTEARIVQDAAEAAAKRMRRGVDSPARGGFPTEAFGQTRWTQEYADALTKVNALVRDQAGLMKQANEANEIARVVYGDEVDKLSLLGQAYKGAKQHILELGGALASAETDVDRSAGAIARIRLETQLYAVAVKDFAEKGFDVVPESEIKRIRELGAAIETAVRSSQTAADFGQIAAALGQAATQTETLFVKQLQLDRLASSVHGRMTQAQKDRAQEANSIEISNQFLARRTGLLGEAVPVEDKIAESENKLAIARLAQINLSEKEIAVIRRNTLEQATGVRTLQNQVDSLETQNATFNMSIAAATEFRLVQDKMNQNLRSGKDALDGITGAFLVYATNVGTATQAGARLNKELEFSNKLQSNLIATRALTARSPEQKGDIAAEQTRLAITREAIKAGMTQAEIEKQIASDRKLAIDTEIHGLTEAQRIRELSAKQASDSLQVQINTIGKSVGETYKLTAVEQARQTLEQEAAQHGQAIDEAKLARLTRLIERSAALTQQQAQLKAQDDATFTSQTLFLTDTDRQVAQLQRSLHGNAWKQFMDDGLAATTRLNSALGQFSSTVQSSVVTSLADITMGTVTAKQGFQNLAVAVLRALEEMLIKMLIVTPVAKALQATLSGLGFGVGGLGGGGVSAAPANAGLGGVYHTGGVVGSTSVPTRVIHNPPPMGLLPRLHGGADLSSDEVFAVLKKGEKVLPPGGNKGGMGGDVFHLAPTIIMEGGASHVDQAQANMTANATVSQLYALIDERLRQHKRARGALWQ